MARPTKLTPELINQIEEHLTLGLSRARACILAGICEDTLANWCKTDSDLALLLEQAEVRGELEHLRNIRAIAIGEIRGDFRASAWFLSRKYPERWGEHHPEKKNADDNSGIKQPEIIDYKQKLEDARRRAKILRGEKIEQIGNVKV